jgi:hypothetical protein
MHRRGSVYWRDSNSSNWLVELLMVLSSQMRFPSMIPGPSMEVRVVVVGEDVVSAASSLNSDNFSFCR